MQLYLPLSYRHNLCVNNRPSEREKYARARGCACAAQDLSVCVFVWSRRDINRCGGVGAGLFCCLCVQKQTPKTNSALPQKDRQQQEQTKTFPPISKGIQILSPHGDCWWENNETQDCAEWEESYSTGSHSQHHSVSTMVLDLLQTMNKSVY